MALRWSKKLSKSDAQQKTQGAKMPFLRFTKSNSGQNHKTWFRNSFFDNLGWSTSLSNRGKKIDEAKIKIDVTIAGKNLGIRTMKIDHIPTRSGNNNAPTTHLHYDNATRQVLEATNLAGRRVVVTRDDQDNYALEVV